VNDSIFRRHLAGILLLASLLIAIGFFLIWPPERQARTLFFPGTTATELSGERRLVPRSRDRDHQVGLVLEELILGPAEIRHGRLLPRDTRVQIVSVVDDTVYVDLSADVMFGADEVRLDVAQGLDGIEQTLLYNFRWLESVHVTIAGQEPDSPAFVPERESTG
jgi:hypothetical protein